MTAPAYPHVPPCPRCGKECWDETKSKFYKPGKPIAKCKDKACGGLVWEQPVAQAPAAYPPPAPMPGQPVPHIVPPQVGSSPGNPLHLLYDECLQHVLTFVAQPLRQQGYAVNAADVIAATATIFIQRSKR